MSSLFEGRDADAAEPLPRWVLNTPTRSVEWWGHPALLAAFAVVLVVGPVLLRARPLLLIPCTIGAATLLAGALAVAIAAHRAFDEQTIEASWRVHQTRVVVAVGTLLVIGLLGLAPGVGEFLTVGVAATGFAPAFSPSTAPRFDHAVRAVATTALAVVLAASTVIGFAVPQLPSGLATTWIGIGFVLVPVTGVSAVIQVRRLRAGRFPER